MKNISLFLILTFCLYFFGCKIISPPTTSSGTYTYLWIASHKDTYISCGRMANDGSCPEGDWNFGDYTWLSVSNTFTGPALRTLKRSYIDFLLPTLPPDTKIEKAYLELFHNAKNEDGKTDNLTLGIQLATDIWDPMTLTYNSEPNFNTTGQSYGLFLRSQNWCGSEDLTGVVTNAISDPSNFYGFVVDYSTRGVVDEMEKAFISNNDSHRTVNDLDHSPRLLLKLELPAGSSINDIVLPPLSSDNDLGHPPGTNVLILRSGSGEDWPSDWDVVAHDG